MKSFSRAARFTEVCVAIYSARHYAYFQVRCRFALSRASALGKIPKPGVAEIEAERQTPGKVVPDLAKRSRSLDSMCPLVSRKGPSQIWTTTTVRPDLRNLSSRFVYMLRMLRMHLVSLIRFSSFKFRAIPKPTTFETCVEDIEEGEAHEIDATLSVQHLLSISRRSLGANKSFIAAPK